MSESNKIYIRLAAPGGTFYDVSQDVSLVGGRVAAVFVTARVAQGLREGLIVELSKAEAKVQHAANKKAESGVEDTAEEVTEEADETPEETEEDKEEKPTGKKPVGRK